MTFDDDYMQFVMPGRSPVRVSCIKAGVTWPPPELVALDGVTYRRSRYSSITDAERQRLDYVIRGAEYLLDGMQ
jgi:hypothetical protein